jgi:hypothetical protein
MKRVLFIPQAVLDKSLEFCAVNRENYNRKVYPGTYFVVDNKPALELGCGVKGLDGKYYVLLLNNKGTSKKLLSPAPFLLQPTYFRGNVVGWGFDQDIFYNINKNLVSFSKARESAQREITGTVNSHNYDFLSHNTVFTKDKAYDFDFRTRQFCVLDSLTKKLTREKLPISDSLQKYLTKNDTDAALLGFIDPFLIFSMGNSHDIITLNIKTGAQNTFHATQIAANFNLHGTDHKFGEFSNYIVYVNAKNLYCTIESDEGISVFHIDVK